MCKGYDLYLINKKILMKPKIKFLRTIAFLIIILLSMNACEKKGGTLEVYNGNARYSANVRISFDNSEVFSGSLSPGETLKKSSDKDVTWKVVYQFFNPGYNTKIGTLSKGEKVIYRLGD